MTTDESSLPSESPSGGDSAPPVAAGVRLSWSSVPADLREKACAFAGGGEVVAASPQRGGFSPGAAVRLQLSTGRRIFVKAVSAEQNPDSPVYYLREARYAAALPPAAPVPRLLGAIEERGWAVLVFEDVDGVMPDPRWHPGELSLVLDAYADMASMLDPSPIEAPPAGERVSGSFNGWRACLRLRDEHGDALAWLDPWARRHLEALAALEVRAPSAMAGTALCHGDIRADNVLLTPDRVVFVDWPWAFIGAPWTDLVFLIPTIWMYGGAEGARPAYEHPLMTKADPGDVTAVAAALAGYCLDRGHQPAPAGLPTLRAFQRRVGDAGLEWVKSRLVDWR